MPREDEAASTGAPKRYERRSHGPLSFWFLNHLLEEKELQRQLKEMKRQGFAGVFMHPRAGLLTPYGSEEWYEMIGTIVATCRAFAVVDWVQDTAWMGKAVNWLYALGVNQLCTHGQFYSIDGPRKRAAPPSQFIQAAYWEHFHALSAYVERRSRELTVGTHQAPVLLYYPGEAFMAQAGSDDGEAERLRDRLAELMDQLLAGGYDFDLVDAQALVEAAVVDGLPPYRNPSDWQPPPCLEVPDGLWQEGANDLEVRCATSPANYLQAMRRPGGFAGRVELCR